MANSVGEKSSGHNIDEEPRLPPKKSKKHNQLYQIFEHQVAQPAEQALSQGDIDNNSAVKRRLKILGNEARKTRSKSAENAQKKSPLSPKPSTRRLVDQLAKRKIEHSTRKQEQSLAASVRIARAVSMIDIGDGKTRVRVKSTTKDEEYT